MRLPELFRQPYPSTESPIRELRQAAVIGLFVGLFLLLFQPFGLSTWQTPDKFLKILGFGLVTFVITGFNFTVWPKLFPRQFSDERWNVGRQIMLITGNILLIAIGNRLYLEWLLNQEGYTNYGSWLGMVLVTFLIGLFPTTGAVMLNYIHKLRKYSQSAAGFSMHPLIPAEPIRGTETVSIPAPEQVENPLTLIADNEKDTVTLDAAQLLYVESSDNYCTVVYQKNSQLVKPLLRSSLSRMEGQINRPRIVRCHRSYVVNLDRVERVTGNAQGYRLHLANGLVQVPVSRQYNDTLVAELKAL
jgi:hypothetical protein